jgi:HK97 family phage portal protein
MNFGTRIIRAALAPMVRAFTTAALAPHASWLASGSRHELGRLGGTPPNATTLTAVHAAVRLLTSGVLGGQFYVGQTLPGGGSRKVETGAASSVIARTPLSVLQPLLNDFLIHGNAFAEIVDGRLVRLPPTRASLVRKDATTQHWLRVAPIYSDVEEIRHLAPGDFLHLKMLPSTSELAGESPLTRVSPALALAVQIIDSAGQIIQNGANPGALLIAPGGMKPESRDRLRADFAKTFSAGAGKAGATAVLDFDAKIERLPTVESTLADAHVALAKFGIAEVARAYGVPLSLLAETSDTNRSTAAEEARQFAIFGVQPLAKQVADALTQFLLTEDEIVAGQSVVIDLRDALLGYGQERAQYASTLVNSGLATRNELRDLLGLPDIEGGDTLAIPANTAPIDVWLAGPAPAPESVPAPDPTKTYVPPLALPAPEQPQVVDFRVALAEARLRAAVAPEAFASHCKNLSKGIIAK